MLKRVPLMDGGHYHGPFNRTRALPLRLILTLVVFLVLCFVFEFINFNTIRQFGFVNVVAMVRPRYEPCNDEPQSLDHWIKTPTNLMHKMSDEELFWRATFVSEIEKYPFRRNTKIAFMFLAKGPLPLAPLWERFFKGHQGHYSIYIHSPPSYNEEFSLFSVFYKRRIPSQLVEWGRISVCDAERRLLANALLDISNEWFILLSESCIPLYKFNFIYQYITRSKYSFMSAYDDPGPNGRGRYNESMAPEVNITEWRKGSQWFEVNRKLAISIVEDTKYYPKFEAFCKPHYCYSDEHYLPTMLSIRAPSLLANWSATWVDWSRSGSHPATFGKADIKVEFFKKMMMKSMCKYNGKNSSVCHVFARKFAPSALEPLLEIAQEAFGY